MSNQEFLESLKRNVVMGHIDKEDEGFDGDMEGKPGVMEQVKEAVETGMPLGEVLNAFNDAMEDVGKKFENGEYLIPDMLASAECVGDAVDYLEPHLTGDSRLNKGTFVMATVKGDLHDIGKNIVVTMLKGAGYDVKDLGINVEADKIVQAVKDNNAKYVGLSALLTTTMTEMGTVINALKEAGVRDQVKVLIGGAPTSEEFSQKIGADTFCRDAFDAIEKMKA